MSDDQYIKERFIEAINFFEINDISIYLPETPKNAVKGRNNKRFYLNYNQQTIYGRWTLELFYNHLPKSHKNVLKKLHSDNNYNVDFAVSMEAKFLIELFSEHEFAEDLPYYDMIQAKMDMEDL